MEGENSSVNIVDSTTNEEDIDFYKDISFYSDEQDSIANDNPMARQNRGPQQSFFDRLYGLSGLMSQRPSFIPRAFTSYGRWNDELDDVERYPAGSRNLTQGRNPVSIVTANDLSNINTSGGRAVMEKVISANVVLLAKCILYPRISGIPAFDQQEKPPGCKTVLVHGFPNNVSQAVVKEVFHLCGSISDAKMQEGNSWHVRYSNELNVGNAILFNGCHVQIDNDSGPPSACRLEVAFTKTRLDQYEYHERLFQREVRARLDSERHRRPSYYYTDREAANIIRRFVMNEPISESLFIICSWLEDKKLDDRNAYQFYSIFQSIKCYLRNLLNDKLRRRNEMTEENRKVQMRIHEVLLRSNIILVLFIAVVDIGQNFFTITQIENLNLWKMEIINILNNFIQQRNFNRCNNLIRSGRNNPVVDLSNSDDEQDSSTRVNNMLRRVSDLLTKAQMDQNIYETTLLRRDTDSRSIREHQEIQDLIWRTRDFYGRVAFLAQSTRNADMNMFPSSNLMSMAKKRKKN